MRLPESYRDVIEGRERPDSWFVAALPAPVPAPDAGEAESLLALSDLDVASIEPASAPEVHEAQWELEVTIRFEDEEEPVAYRVWLVPSERMSDRVLVDAGLRPEERQEARDSQWSLGVSTRFGERPLWDYHRQVKVLAAVTPEAVVARDVGLEHSWDWVLEVAASTVPPSPHALYGIHAVWDEETGGKTVWMHTHGLLRCGSLELEMLNVSRDGTGSLGQLLNVVAPLFIERGVPDPGEPFEPGQGLALVWLPWEEALRRAPRRCLGGGDDRDEYHSLPSGVLFVPARGLFGRRYRNPSVLIPALEDNPLLWISTMETDRMRMLAWERLDVFVNLFQSYGGQEFAFLVKLGFEMDGAKKEDEREHLWFEVHAINGDQVDATLVNEPYYIARMHEGQRGTHSLENLTDWCILCEHGEFNPGTVVNLQRILEDTAQDDHAPEE